MIYINQDDVLTEVFEQSCANIEALSVDMIEAFDAENWAELLKLNNEIDIQLQAIRIDQLTAGQKPRYKQVLEAFYASHHLTTQKCGGVINATEAELGLLRKKKSAGSIYQQVQDV